MSPCTCILLRTAARKVTAVYDEALRPHGVTIAQYSLLRRIKAVKEVSLTELGRLAELDRSTIGRNVRVLERMGLVTMDLGADHREASVRLSEQGIETLAACFDPWNEAQRSIESLVGRDGIAALQQLAAEL